MNEIIHLNTELSVDESLDAMIVELQEREEFICTGRCDVYIVICGVNWNQLFGCLKLTLCVNGPIIWLSSFRETQFCSNNNSDYAN